MHMQPSRNGRQLHLPACLLLSLTLAACGGGGGGNSGGMNDSSGGSDGSLDPGGPGSALMRQLPNGGQLQVPAGTFDGEAADIQASPHTVDLGFLGLAVVGDGVALDFGDNPSPDFGIVSFPPPQGVDPMSVALARIDDFGGVTILDTTFENGMLTAPTPGFSAFHTVQDPSGARPDVNIVGPAFVATGTTVGFTETQTPANGETAFPHEWVAFGRGEANRGTIAIPSTGNSASVAFPVEGPYLVGVTVTNPLSGLSAFDTFAVSVQDDLAESDAANAAQLILFTPEDPDTGEIEVRAVLAGNAMAPPGGFTFTFSGTDNPEQAVSVGPGAREATAVLDFPNGGANDVAVNVELADGTVIHASKPIFLDPSPIEFEIVDIEGPDQVTPGLADRAAALDAHNVDVIIEITEPFGPKNTRIFHNGFNIERFDTVNQVDSLPRSLTFPGLAVFPGLNIFTAELAQDGESTRKTDIHILDPLPLTAQASLEPATPSVGEDAALTALIAGGNVLDQDPSDGAPGRPYRVEIDWGDGSPVERRELPALIDRVFATQANSPEPLGTHRYEEPGEFTVIVTVSDFAGNITIEELPINISDTPEGLPFEPEEAQFFVRVRGEFDDGSTGAVDIESSRLPGTLNGTEFEFNGASDNTDSGGTRRQRQGSINGTYGADFRTIESATWESANQITFNGSPVRSGSSTVRIRNLPEDLRLDFRAFYVARGEAACEHIQDLSFTDTDGGDTRTLVDFSCDLNDPFVSISIEGEPK